MAGLASVQITVYGRVQGVFFRVFIAEHADGLGLIGYVRNLPSGFVETRAEGEREQLEKLIRYLKAGPPGARVDKVLTSWAKYTGNYSGFRIRY
ncbi:acylphosphatase [Chloroflexota bacterium]